MYTALMLAAYRGRIELIPILIEAGANVDKPGSKVVLY